MRRLIFVLFLLLPLSLGCKGDGLNLKIRYDQILGLQKNDRVIFGQNHIGTVKDVIYTEKDAYVVDIIIIKNFAPAATEHSQFFIITDPKNKERMAIEMIHTMKGGSPLKNNSMIEGTTKTSAFINQLLDQFVERYGGIEQEFEALLKKMSGIPESEEFKKLEDELRRLKKEMAKSGEEIKKKIQTEVLPRLKEEMEALRERLRELGREDELRPLEIEMEKMRKI